MSPANQTLIPLSMIEQEIESITIINQCLLLSCHILCSNILSFSQHGVGKTVRKLVVYTSTFEFSLFKVYSICLM